MTNANSTVKSAILMIVGFSLATAVAETYHWTGGAGNTGGVYQWNEAGNWQENAVPGLSETSDDEVVFGAMEGNPASVTIDLTGEVAVRTVRFADAAAPAYQLGASRGTSKTDEGQSMRLRTGGEVVVSPEVTNAQCIMRLASESADGATLAISNASMQAELAIDTIDRWLASDQSAKYCQYTLAGTGRILLFDYIWTGSAQPSFTFKGSLSVIWRNDGSRLPRSLTFASGWTGTFEIADGAILNAQAGTSPFNNVLQFAEDTTIDGQGAIQASKMVNSDREQDIAKGNTSLRSFLLNVTAKKTVTVNVPLKPASGYEGWIPLYSAKEGTIRLNGANSLLKGVVIHGNVNVEAQKFGSKGCTASETSLGLADEIVFQPYFAAFEKNSKNYFNCETRLDASLGYAGSEDTTCDRDFMILNCYKDYQNEECKYFYVKNTENIDYDSCCATATVATVGSGALTLTGCVKTWADGSGAVFGLDARTAPIVFKGSFLTSGKIGLSVRGQEKVTLDGVNVSDLSSLEISSCVLEMTGAGSEFTIDRPVRTRGENTIEVKSGSSLRISWEQLTMDEDSTVDFIVPDDSSVVFEGATSATVAPAGLTQNGVPVHFNDDGKILPYESRWNSAVNGAWKDGAKWNNGIPTAQDKARITVGGADYTVTVDEPLAAIPASVEIGQGETGFISTLAIAADIESSAIPFLVNADGELKVTTGGTLDLTGSSVDLSEGGTFTADGEGTVLAATSDSKVLTFGTGVWTFKGNSCLTSEVASAEIDIKPSEAGACAELVLDTSEIPTAGQHSFEKGSIYLGGQAGGTAKFVVTGKDDTTAETNYVFAKSMHPWRISISRNGYGEIDLQGGYLRIGNNGLWIGSSEKASAALAVTGVVNQTGGYVQQGASGATAAKYLVGLKIGCGEYYTRSRVSADDISCFGTYNLMDGQLSSSPGYTVIGAGSGVGRLIQTGGTFSHDSSANSSTYFNHLTDTKNFQYPMIIGLVGGSGLYVLSNGTAKVTKDFYIGGAQTNEMPWATTVGIDPATYPEENYDARGVLSVQGGTFTCSSNVFVGVAGSGTIEFGAAGSLTARTLVLSNANESALAFAIPAGGYAAAPLAVTDRMKLTSGSKLTVDVRGIAGRKLASWTKLVSASAIDGDFGTFEIICADEDREFYKDATYELSRNEEPGVWFRMPKKGQILLFR